ncbi:hypothetical protein [Paenibacillus mucilaginosus]|uniref:Uncharacterized protein n=1 Tax=Paenibacillus mucilaginosus (strain KNP414) TaxID=1036673 RepID=F8FF89_PAEMK|nr:hypothetical protein [Paenibacillus mucilaginosus]AEI41807.1 hypothetical protein KNP414_03249 [Paenibacillus mucilaginosus KNP414]MCG7214490.1 hypothetical protein [Paenibacillus mucilaginosus]WDM30772.1 hypothetical protein KCX80_17135 [Paenibacillus mucilaginosus]
MEQNPFVSYESALGAPGALEAFRREMTEEGFTPFRLFLEGFRERLKTFGDGETERVRDLLDTAKGLFPEPRVFSPSWALVWDEFEGILTTKSAVLASIPQEKRDGEWQIILDNPFTNTDLVCYPGMTFMNAAYMYAYFRTDLKQNEYLRLQKVATLIITQGGEELGLVTARQEDR